MPKAGPTAKDWNDHRLVAEMRSRDSVAFEEFFARFAPLLRDEASRLRLQPAHREEAVVECLEQTALALIREPAVMPASLAGELVARLIAATAQEIRRPDTRVADTRALEARRSLTHAEASQTAADAVKFGRRIRVRVGQRRAP